VAPERFVELEQCFHRAVDMDESRRESFIQELKARDVLNKK